MTTSYNLQTLLTYYILLSFLPCITPATSIGNPDLERYFRTSNSTQTFASEERITMDVYTYAFLNYSFMDNHEMQFINYPEEKARYGEGKILSVHGQLVHISDVNDPKNDTACSGNILGTKGRPTPQQGITWIALVRRGHCTFEEKVRNVHLKGAAGVIIYNDKPVINLEKMQIKGKTRNITAVITYQDIGLAMAMRLDDDVEVMAHIIEGRSGMRPISSFNRTSVLFVAISFIILMLISLIWLIVYYIQRFRNLHTKDQQSRHLCSVTQKAIMKIPTKTGKTSDEKDADSDCCAICIEAYKISDLIRVLPCKHEFHKNCIDPWLIEHRTCPMCKLDVLKFYGYVVGDELQTIPTPAAPLPTIAIDEPDVPVVVVGVLPTQTTVSSLNQYHQYSHHRNPHPSNAQQQQQQQQHQLQMNGNECGSISSSSNSYDSSATANPPQQCTLATQQCCNNVEGRAQPIELGASNSSCGGGGGGVSGSSCSNNNGHQSCASISNNSCPIHTIAHMPPAQCNRSNLLNGHHQKNDLCSWHISVPGLNLTINSNQPFVVESPANDNALNDARSSQFCTSSRQVTDFLGSEESVLEYEADRSPEPNQTNTNASPPVPAPSTTQRPNNTLVDLIRSREFVMEFPRVFVYEPSTDNAGGRRCSNNRFLHDLPERSQSSLSFSNPKEWMPVVANKLEEQHGLRRDNKIALQENHLRVKPEFLNRRRTRSVDGRYADISYTAVRKAAEEFKLMETNEKLPLITASTSQAAESANMFKHSNMKGKALQSPSSESTQVIIQVNGEDLD